MLSERVQKGVKQVHDTTMQSKYGVNLKYHQQPEMVGWINNILNNEKKSYREIQSFDTDGRRKKLTHREPAPEESIIMVPYHEKDGLRTMKSIQQYMNHLNNAAEKKNGDQFSMDEVKELLEENK